MNMSLENKKAADVTIGFIGLGNLGTPMVHRLLGAGRRVIVWGRSPEKLTAVLEASAHRGHSPAGLAGDCAFLLMCVTDTAAVEEIVFGPGGVAEG
ncbi:MAG: NAD(P)-binding domain-containing protein, partial [Deltaproteobacteria bacterium]|nr:NAD(P)-binding domain-containing protein [Deltaproteobacteria bacterium]